MSDSVAVNLDPLAAEVMLASGGGGAVADPATTFGAGIDMSPLSALSEELQGMAESLHVLKTEVAQFEQLLAEKSERQANHPQVLKLRYEMALATNKRLTDALERQRAAQAQRQRHAKDQPDAVTLEVEMIFSLIDAEHSLEQLMGDRAVINAHCNEIKQSAQTQPQGEQAQLLASLEEELEMRNALIADLQQKVSTIDLDSRMRALSELNDESRVISKQLKSLVQLNREYCNIKQRIMEQIVLFEEQRRQRNEEQQRFEEMVTIINTLVNTPHLKQFLIEIFHGRDQIF